MQLKLNIGCGDEKIDGFLGLDLHKKPAVEVLASATNLPFTDESINEIYTRRCLQHIVDETQAINEMFRVLKIDGTAKVIVASHRGWIYYFLSHLCRRKPYPTFHLYTASSLKKKMARSGFLITGLSTTKTRRLGYDFVANAAKKKSPRKGN